MSLAALLTWIITAGAGLYLLTIWLIEYDGEFQSEPSEAESPGPESSEAASPER